MALIRLCLVEALELAVEAPGTSSSGDRIWVRRWDVAFEQMLDLLSAGLLYCDEKKQTITFCYSGPILLGALFFTSRGLISNVS